jgi:hypothetical protein
MNRTEYRVIGSLQSFRFYNYFRVELVHGRHIYLTMPSVPNLRCRYTFDVAVLA